MKIMYLDDQAHRDSSACMQACMHQPSQGLRAAEQGVGIIIDNLRKNAYSVWIDGRIDG